MRLDGALSNPETAADLRNLTEVVSAAAARPEPEEGPKAQCGRRPGWVAPLVLRVLESATEPMTAKTVKQEILRRFGEQPAYDSVRHVLRFGTEARLGLIERAGGGRYVARLSTPQVSAGVEHLGRRSSPSA